MKETSKAVARRLHDVAFVRYFAGRGLDVGSGDDCLGQYRTLFPLMGEVLPWDKQQGDAQLLAGVPDGSFDFVHSSHCLEHLRNPAEALYHWCRVVRSGGFLVILVPDEGLYEQGVWPSRWNGDHKHSFTLGLPRLPASVNVFGLLGTVADLAEPIKVERLESSWRTDRPGEDQTKDSPAECSIEIVLRKL